MTHTSYPTAEDLNKYLKSLGILETSTADQTLAAMNLEVKVGAAKDTWEHDTGWHPFLQEGADFTRRFDPPGARTSRWRRGGGNVLDFGAGLLQVTELRVGVSNTDAGTVLVQGQDFWLGPENADEQDVPYKWVEFTTNWYSWVSQGQMGGPRSISILGRWGYCWELSDDVWDTVLKQAALKCGPELYSPGTFGISRIKTLATEVEFSAKGIQPFLDEWGKAWDRQVRQHKRVTL